MQNYSSTIAFLLVALAGFFGWGDVVTEGEIAEAINAITQLVGIVGAWVGRVRAKGPVNPLGFRK